MKLSAVFTKPELCLQMLLCDELQHSLWGLFPGHSWETAAQCLLLGQI